MKKIKAIGFVKSKIDPCLFYKESIMYVLYTDDYILVAPKVSQIEQVIVDIK